MASLSAIGGGRIVPGRSIEGGRSARGRSRIADRRGEFAWSVEHDKCGAFRNFVQSCLRKGIEKSPGVIEGKQPVGGTPHECDGFVECLDGRGGTQRQGRI